MLYKFNRAYIEALDMPYVLRATDEQVLDELFNRAAAELEQGNGYLTERIEREYNSLLKQYPR